VRPSNSDAGVPRHCSGDAYSGVNISPRADPDVRQAARMTMPGIGAHGDRALGRTAVARSMHLAAHPLDQ
jgi:hypothetical protein